MKRFKLSWRWFPIGLALIGILAHLYIVFSPANSLMNWYTTDDAFYYYKVAINIVSGAGVTFDGINLTNGFHPLWMLVCIAVFWLAKFDLILPLRVLVFISGLFNIGTGLLLFRLLKRFVSPWIAATAVMVWTFSPAIYSRVIMNGMEAIISAFLIVLLFTLAVEWQEESSTLGREIVLGLVAGLTVLARLDNIFVVLLLGVWFVLRSTGAWIRNLVIGDLALVFISGLLSYYIRLRTGPFYLTYSYSLGWLLGLGFLLKPLAFYLFSLYQRSKCRPGWGFLLRGGLATTLVSVLIGGVLVVLQRFGVFPDLPRALLILGQILIIDWTGTLLGMFALRLFVGWYAGESASANELDFRSFHSWKPILRSGLAYFVPVGLLLGAYLTWNRVFIGTWIPVSGSIKHWWSTLRNPVYGSVIQNMSELFGMQGRINSWGLALSPFTSISRAAARYLGSIGPYISMAVILLLAALLVCLVVLRRKWLASLLDRMGLFVFFLGLYCHIFYYSTTSYVHARPWYWVGEMFFAILLFGILLEAVRLTFDRVRWKPWLGKAALVFMGVLAFASFAIMLHRLFPYQLSPQKEDVYLDETRFLELQTEPGARIGMTGGGVIAYFIHDRVIFNMDGLINSPEYFDALRTGTVTTFLDRMKIDYIYGGSYVLTVSEPYREILAGRLQKKADLDGIILYQYLPPVQK